MPIIWDIEPIKNNEHSTKRKPKEIYYMTFDTTQRFVAATFFDRRNETRCYRMLNECHCLVGEHFKDMSDFEVYCRNIFGHNVGTFRTRKPMRDITNYRFINVRVLEGIVYEWSPYPTKLNNPNPQALERFKSMKPIRK